MPVILIGSIGIMAKGQMSALCRCRAKRHSAVAASRPDVVQSDDFQPIDADFFVAKHSKTVVFQYRLYVSGDSGILPSQTVIVVPENSERREVSARQMLIDALRLIYRDRAVAA